MHLQHYFELSLTLDSEKFNILLNRAFGKSNGELYSDGDKYVDHALAHKGITISYHDNSHKKKVKLTVHLDGSSDETDSNRIAKMLHKLENRIGDYFNSEYTIDDFRLNRMGIIADIDVHEKKKVTAYMRVLQRLGKVKKFSPSSNSQLNSDFSFCLEGNSNGIDFLIYDLEKVAKSQLTEAESKRWKLKSVTEYSRFSNATVNEKRLLPQRWSHATIILPI